MPATFFNPLDWFLMAVLLYSAVRAALRGFVRECFALGGLLAGFLLACWYYQPLARTLHGLLNSPTMAQFIAFLLIVVAVMAAATLLGTLIHRTATTIGLGFLNRAAGAAFGLIRGAIMASAFLLALAAFLPASPWVQGSRLAPYLLGGTHALSFLMPSELAVRLSEGRDRLKHTIPGWIKSPHPSHTT